MAASDLWLQASLPHEEYASAEHVDATFGATREALESGTNPSAWSRVSSALAWAVLRDDVYRKVLYEDRDVVLQDGLEDFPDAEVEESLPEEDPESSSFHRGLCELERELALAAGMDEHRAGKVRSAADLGEPRDPAPGRSRRFPPSTSWRGRLSSWQKRKVVVVSAVLWLTAFIVVGGIATVGGWLNPVATYLVDELWPIAAVGGIGTAYVARRSYKVVEYKQSRNDGIWRSVVNRTPNRVGLIDHARGWPVWAWTGATVILAIWLPVMVSVPLALALLWGFPWMLPAEGRRRLVGLLRGKRDVVSPVEFVKPECVPDPRVPGLVGQSRQINSAACPVALPHFTRLGTPVGLAEAGAPLVRVGSMANVDPDTRGSATAQVAAVLVLDMWAGCTGSRLPLWSGRFGVWSTSVLADAVVLFLGGVKVPAVTEGVARPFPSRCVASWWEQEAEAMRQFTLSELDVNEARAALLRASEVLLSWCGGDAGIPDAIRLRVETFAFAATYAASSLSDDS